MGVKDIVIRHSLFFFSLFFFSFLSWKFLEIMSRLSGSVRVMRLLDSSFVVSCTILQASDLFLLTQMLFLFMSEVCSYSHPLHYTHSCIISLLFIGRYNQLDVVPVHV